MSVFTVEKPTPVLNTPYFSKVYGTTLPFDQEGLVREVEMVALPEMTFQVIQEHADHIIEVTTDAYPTFKSLYIDRRYGKVGLKAPPEKKLPSVDEILEFMQGCLGFPYIWGGNYHLGIPDWEKHYPPPNASKHELAHWNLKGVDCSGLLFEACQGLIPRNTSELMSYGQEVSLGVIQALDLILFPGHVIIALSPEEVIESWVELGGVVKNPLPKRLSEVNQPIMVRRFHPDVL